MNLSMNMRLAFRNGLMVLLTIFTCAPGYAQISTNPDDYDVPHYQSAYQDSVRRLQDAEAQLQGLEARRQQSAEASQREAHDVEAIEGRLVTQRNLIVQAAQAMGEIEVNVRNAQNEIDQNDGELSNLAQQLQQEQARNEQLRQQNSAAQTASQQAKQTATQAEQALVPLQQSLQAKQNDQRQAQAELDRLTNDRIQPLERQAAVIQRDIELLERQKTGLEAEKSRNLAAQQKAENDAAESDQQVIQYGNLAATMQARYEQTGNEMFKQQADAARKNSEFYRGNSVSSRQAARDYQARAAGNQAAAAGFATQINAKQNDLSALKSQLASARSSLTPARQRVQTAEAEVQTAQQRLSDATRNVEPARRAAQGAATRAQTAQQAMAQSDQRLVELQQRPNQLQERQRVLRQYIAQQSQATQQQRAAAQAAREVVARLTPQLEIQKRQSAQADRVLQQASRERNQGAVIAADARQYAESMRTRLSQVEENLRRGIEIARNEGSYDGQLYRHREGNEQGRTQGLTEGTDVGQRDGMAQGTQAGVDDAKSRGASAGRVLGQTEGTQKGSADGRAKGNTEGAAKGRSEGLVAGYEAGRTEGDTLGYPEGQKAGLAAGGFNQGRLSGAATGTRRATDEGNAQGMKIGLSRADADFMGAQLHEVIIPNQTNARSALFGKKVEATKKITPARNAGRYPHPAMQQAYDEAFAMARQDAAARAYDEARTAAYHEAYDPAFRSSWDRAVRGDFSRYYQDAYNTSRTHAYGEAYTIAMDEAFRSNYRPAYDTAYALALPIRKEEGRKEGRADGFTRGKADTYASELERGRAEGDQSAYAATFPGVLATATQRGYDDGVRKFSTNAVLKYEGSNLVDANDDGIFTPGEAVSITMIVKNFGKIPQANDLSLVLENPTRGLTIERGSDTLPKIPGQSRTTITAITQLRVRTDGVPGAQEQVSVRVLDGSTELGSVRLNLVSGYPYSVPVAKETNIVTPGRENLIRIQLHNQSKKASGDDIILRLISTDRRATVSQGTTNIGRVSAGADAEGTLSFTISDQNANESLQFEIQALEGNLIVGRRTLTIDSVKRWSYNPNAAGVMIVATAEMAKLAEATQTAAGEALDIFDVRAEGDLTPVVTKKYAGKLIVIPAVTNDLSDSTAQAIRVGIEAGVSVLAQMSTGSDRTAVGAVILSKANTMPKTTIEGLSVAQDNYFIASLGNSLIAVAPEARLDVAILAGRLITAKLVLADVTAKITTLASFSDQPVKLEKVKRLLIRDLVKEMQDDKAVDGKNFQDHRENTRVQKFTTLAVQQTGAVRVALLAAQKELESAAKNTGNIFSGRRKAILKILEPFLKLK